MSQIFVYISRELIVSHSYRAANEPNVHLHFKKTYCQSLKLALTLRKLQKLVRQNPLQHEIVPHISCEKVIFPTRKAMKKYSSWVKYHLIEALHPPKINILQQNGQDAYLCT